LGISKTFRLKVFIYRSLSRLPILHNFKQKLWIGRLIRFKELKIQYINPLDVKYQVRRSTGPSPYIDQSDWDLNKRNFQWNDAVVQLFVEYKEPELTDQYKSMQKAIDNKDWHTSRNCKNTKQLKAYFETLKDIYKDMSSKKYKPSTQVKSRYQNTRKRYYPDEICVSIGRNGEFIVERGGGHRLSIAQLIRIEKIPVIIIGMHYSYAKENNMWII